MKLRETLRTCYDTPDTLATASADGTVTVQSWRYRFAAHHLVTEIQRQQKKQSKRQSVYEIYEEKQ